VLKQKARINIGQNQAHILMGVWQEVAINSLKVHPDLPCPTLLHPASRPPLKRPYSHFRDGPPTGQAAIFYPFGHPSHPTLYAYGYSIIVSICICAYFCSLNTFLYYEISIHLFCQINEEFMIFPA
jgi:hypothetical protein